MPDGTTVPVSLFESAEPRSDIPVIVVFPGLGIPAGYYQLLAKSLNERGFHIAIAELRGQGDRKSVV